MSTKNNEIKALNRLFETNNYFNEIIDFLASEGVLDKHNLPSKIDGNHAVFLHEIISVARNNGKLQLSSYEWILLPKEKVELTLITAYTARTFSWFQS